MTAVQCTVCSKHRATLRSRKSKLISSITLFLCQECFDKKNEPRFAVILTARDPDRGMERARPYIRGHRYHGPKILAEELT